MPLFFISNGSGSPFFIISKSLACAASRAVYTFPDSVTLPPAVRLCMVSFVSGVLSSVMFALTGGLSMLVFRSLTKDKREERKYAKMGVAKKW
jgi:hypothetical protein